MFPCSVSLALSLSRCLSCTCTCRHTTHTHRHTHTVQHAPSQPESDIIGYCEVWKEHKSRFHHLVCFQKRTQKRWLWNASYIPRSDFLFHCKEFISMSCPFLQQCMVVNVFFSFINFNKSVCQIPFSTGLLQVFFIHAFLRILTL